MSDIPKAREILHELKVNWGLGPRVRDELQRALELMYREKPTSIAERESAVITKAMALEIKRLRIFNRWSVRRIAERFNINHGRVRDVVTGRIKGK